MALRARRVLAGAGAMWQSASARAAAGRVPVLARQTRDPAAGLRRVAAAHAGPVVGGPAQRCAVVHVLGMLSLPSGGGVTPTIRTKIHTDIHTSLGGRASLRHDHGVWDRPDSGRRAAGLCWVSAAAAGAIAGLSHRD